MTCAGCAARATRALDAVPVVERADVNLALDRATLLVNDHSTAEGLAISALEEAGFTATPHRESSLDPDDNGKALKRDQWSVFLGAMLTAPLVAMMVFPIVGVPFHLPAWQQMLLAAPVQFVLGFRFYRGAYVSLRGGAGNMDVLVALGTSAAFVLSTWIMAREGLATTSHLYFEASAVIITLVLTGKLLESRAKRATTSAIRQLMDLRPDVARVRRGDEVVEVAAELVQVDDVVCVLPGERIPVDGEVIEGASEVDEALITGEAIPVLKEPGDTVTGGSINGIAAIDIRTLRVGNETTLSRIINLVESAQSGRAPVQRLVDRISAIFVPVVVLLAMVTLVGWLSVGSDVETAVITAVSVLVIACPCALGLATPTALVAGMGAAARAGILIRDIDVLERAHKVDQVLFDKTGTLTTGYPEVIEVMDLLGDEAEMLSLAASIQANSEHPLARAIVSYAQDRGTVLRQATGVAAAVGQGVAGHVSGTDVALGNSEMMGGVGVDVSSVAPTIESICESGATPVFVSADERLIGIFSIRDRLRDNSPTAIEALGARGIETGMLSGDAKRTAETIAKTLKLGSVMAEVTPDLKALEIEKRQIRGHVVAMVGDGLNDAPALASADVGIAMGSGTDVAMETAGITLMRPDPRLVFAALDAARATWQRIRWNLFWAFIFNVIGLPLAAFGYLSPEFAGAAMAMSSVTVVTSSLMLRRWRPQPI